MAGKLLIFLGLYLISPAAQGATQVTHCDLPGGASKSFSAKDVASCRTSCESDPSCEAYSFISGWNRCFYKGAKQPQVRLRIFSGVISAVDGVRSASGPLADTDIPGKDLRKVIAVNSAGECGVHCISDPRCVAYSFLDGYRDCWLKDRLGHEQEKIFYCGVK